MRFSLLIISLFFAIVPLSAQLPSDFRTEQIFLCPAKTVWASSDTIEAEGMVTCDAAHRWKPYSRYLYVELIDSNDSLLLRNKIRCADNGFFKTSIPPGYAVTSGVYYLRAYTNMMRSFSMESFAVQPLLINKLLPKRVSFDGTDAKCMIYPSGGRLIYGSIQNMAAFLTNSDRLPLAYRQLSLVNGRDTVAVCSTSASGFATFSFIPQQGGDYHLAFTEDNTTQTFAIPEVSVDGMKLTAFLSGKNLKYSVEGNGKNLSDCRLYVYDRQNGLIKMEKPLPQGIIKFSNTPYIATLFLTDSSYCIMSEISAIGAESMKGELLLANDTVSAGENASYRIAGLSDSICTTIARLVPDNDSWAMQAEEALKFKADFRSEIPFPKEIFEESASDRWRDLQAWLMTATFSRFTLKEAAEKGEKIYTHIPEEVMAFRGSVKSEFGGLLKKSTLVAYNTDNARVYEAPIGADGRFEIAVDDFCNGTSFFLQATDKNMKPVFANIQVDDATYPLAYVPQHFSIDKPKYIESGKVEVNGRIHDQILPDVVVKAWLRAEKPVPTNKFYSTNYVDRESIEKHNYQTLLDILTNMPGIMVRRNDVNLERDIDEDPRGFLYSIMSTRGASLFGGETGSDGHLTVLVDGSRVAEVNESLMLAPSSEIETVELLRPWQTNAIVSGAIHGAIAITTRKYHAPSKIKSKGTYYTPLGLSNDTVPIYSGVRAETPGRYRLAVDVFTDKGVQSFARSIVIK